MYFYDLMRTKGMLSPALTMDASPDGRAVYACAFNARRPEWFATGGASGIQVCATRRANLPGAWLHTLLPVPLRLLLLCCTADLEAARVPGQR